MKCKNCFKVIFSQIKCHLCNNLFCSNPCLDSHIFINHKSSNLQKNKIYEKPKIERINNNDNIKAYSISSPYITDGFISNQIKYESIYDLKNFRPILEYNSPKIIGIGSYGKVYLYKNLTDNKLYAIKHLDKMILCKSIHTIKRIYDEINIQSRIHHQNIVKLLYVKENDSSIYLIMEYANSGSLYRYIRTKQCLTEEESFKFFSQIINAIYFLHKNDFIHRDIKPENILIFDNNICKLCDFGCCVELNGKQRSTYCGTTEYMSPEIVNKIEYSKEIDIWSLGILLYEMIHGYSPFNPNNEYYNTEDVIDKIKIHDLHFDINISKECKDLICHLLEKNAKNRYKIEDIFNCDFIKKYEKKKLYFLNEKYIINNKNENKYNLTDIKKNNNALLLSSLIENDNIINKTLFNNIKYNETKKLNMKNKINNVIFNNVINRNQNNQILVNENINNEFNKTRELNRNINIFNSNNMHLNSFKDVDINNNNSYKNKKTVKVTKLSKNFIPDDMIKPNISNVKKINNDSELSKDSPFYNISSFKTSNKKFDKNLINSRHQYIKGNDKGKNELNSSYFEMNNIKKKLNPENTTKSTKSISQPTRKQKINIKEKNNNNFIKNDNDKTFNNEYTNIKKKYYIKPKIEKDFCLIKDNTKDKEKQKQKNNAINFKNCINSKIKIPRRKILNSLHLENINILNNIDLLNNNEEPSLNISNNLNNEFFQMNEISSIFPTNNFENKTYRIEPTNRYESCSNDNSIKTQINKNYIFNPNISINLPKYSFSNQKNKQKVKRKIKIKEIKEDIKDKLDSPEDLSKSQIIQNNKFLNNIKSNNIKNLFNEKRNKSEMQNNLIKNDSKESPRIMTQRKIHKTKTNNNLLSENTFKSQIIDKLHNISPCKSKVSQNQKNQTSKSIFISPDKQKELGNNKKLNVKQKENKQINLNLIKDNKIESAKVKGDLSFIINNNYIDPISERTQIKRKYKASDKYNLLTERINNSRYGLAKDKK